MKFIDRQFIKYLLPQESAMSTLGIYGAALKLGGILLLFVQMFRLAAEPFFLAAFKKEDFLKANAETLKYFLIVSMLLFLVIFPFLRFLWFDPRFGFSGWIIYYPCCFVC